MKILHVCSGKGLGGTRTVFLSHQRLFERIGADVTPVIRRGAAVKSWLSVTSKEKLKELGYFRRFPIKFQKDYLKMKKLCESHDLIWLHKPIDCHIWRKISKTSKIALIVHGFQNTKLKEADYLIAVSLPVFEHLKRKGFKNVFLLKNFTTFPVSEHEITWNKQIQISAFGFFRNKKGFLDLIDAIDILQNQLNCKEFKVDIYGSGRMLFILKLKKYLQKVTKLNINSWTLDIQKKFQSSDIVVIPSRSESFSMIAIEAMAAGCLILSTKCKGPEFIITDGVDGILTEVKNPKLMAEKLFEIIEHSQRFTKIRQNGRKTASKKFSIKSAQEVMRNILKTI
ncbi:MAG: glycosyltransferase family 4 protein [Holosporales bacterium]|nr:glycosyltransferase family 4 protein [Holosporales bacterium]